MRKLLPKSIASPKGFSLVELLVVITIIAILGTIGISVYSGAQLSARDGVRRAEIQSIAKSLESAKDYENANYFYDVTTAGKDFPKGFPDDVDATKDYCIAVSAATAPPAAPTTWAATACPTAPAGWTTIVTSYTAATAALELADGTVKSWRICAKMSRSGPNPYECETSLTN